MKSRSFISENNGNYMNDTYINGNVDTSVVTMNKFSLAMPSSAY